MCLCIQVQQGQVQWTNGQLAPAIHSLQTEENEGVSSRDRLITWLTLLVLVRSWSAGGTVDLVMWSSATTQPVTSITSAVRA